jgi:serine O-acetyltransferase
MLVGRNIREDYIQKYHLSSKENVKVSMTKVLSASLQDRGFRAVLLYRMGRYFRVHGLVMPAKLTERIIHRLCFCEVSTSADIGPGFAIYHPFGLVVGTDVKAGKNLTLSMDVVLGGNIDKQRPDGSEKPILGDNVNIGAGSKMAGPITLGDNCLVGANSVVINSMPSDSIIAGVPAQVIKHKGHKISILEHNGQLYDTLRDILSRLEEIENKLTNKSGKD